MSGPPRNPEPPSPDTFTRAFVIVFAVVEAVLIFGSLIISRHP